MRNVVGGIFIASSLVVGTFAQEPGQQPAQGRPGAQQPAAPGQPPSAPVEQPVTRQQPPTPQVAQLAKTTISGCIQNAPPAAPAAGGAPAAAAAAKFDLANAKVVTAGPVGTAGSTSTAVRYRLEGDEKAITPHLNHQVEITGTVSPASGTGATAAPMLKVDSVKMVAATCPESSR